MDTARLTEKIDVFIPTLNSQATIEATLDSLITGGVPINGLIVVDGFSIDGTYLKIKNWAWRHAVKLSWYQDRGGLGSARILGNKKASTPVYLSIDSDVLLTPNWYNVVRSRLDSSDEYAYVSSYLVFGNPGSIVYETFNAFRKSRTYTPVLAASLVRRDKVDFSVMKGVKMSEDTIFNFHLIEDMGGRYAVEYDTFALHPSTITRDLKHIFGWGRGAREIGRHPLIEIARVPRAAVKATGYYLNGGSPLLIFYLPFRELIHLTGFATGKRIRESRGLFREFEVILKNREMVRRQDGNGY